MYFIRGTELQDFLRCRKMWSYRWIDGLQLKKPNNKLFFGTLFHKFLETYYGPNYGWNDTQVLGIREGLEAVEQDILDGSVLMDEVEFQELHVTLTRVIEEYHKQYYRDLENWEVIATELTFAIPLDDEIGYTGTIDLIVRDKSDGKIYLVDHKTTNSIEKYDKNSDMDRQISRYWWALQQLQQGKGMVKYGENDSDWMDMQCADKLHWDLYNDGNEIGGFVYNIILKDYPIPPKVLKNGSLSKDKSQKTTYEMYWQALRDYGISERDEVSEWVPREYDDILSHLHDNPREYFRRIFVTRTQSEIDASIEELYATAMDMSPHEYTLYEGHRPLPKIYRNITKDCPWCPFQPICQASMDGSNVDFLVESLYTKEEK